LHAVAMHLHLSVLGKKFSEIAKKQKKFCKKTTPQ